MMQKEVAGNKRKYSPQQADSEKKRTLDMMFLKVCLGGDFLWHGKDKLFILIRRAETGSRSFKVEGMLVLSAAQIFSNQERCPDCPWSKKVQRSVSVSLKDQRGVWKRKYFSSLEEENACWKAQVEYLKKRHPICAGRCLVC